jgi:hypothetical protein
LQVGKRPFVIIEAARGASRRTGVGTP